MHIEDRLRQSIKVTGLSQRDFAKCANLPLSSLSEYLAGKKRPGFDALVAIATASGVSADWLLMGEEKTKPTEKISTPDIVLLTQIIEAIEAHLGARRKKLPPSKKAQLIALLYEHCYKDGEIDLAYVNSMMGVAA